MSAQRQQDPSPTNRTAPRRPRMLQEEDAVHKRPSTHNVVDDWNTTHLIQLESVLQLYFAQPRVVGLRSNSTNNKNLLPLDEFFGLTRKLSFQRPVSSTVRTNREDSVGANDEDDRKRNDKDHHQEEIQPDDDLDEMETLLFQLLCVSCPILYRLYQGSEGETTGWCLEQVTSSEHRVSQLRQLIRERNAASQTNDARAQHFRHVIRTHRQKAVHRKDQNTAAAKPCTSATETAKPWGEPTNHRLAAAVTHPTGVTVEERVQARANAKRKFQEEEEKASGPGNTKEQHKNDDKSWLVPLADALWSHARTILQRQARFQSPQSRLTATATTKAAAPLHCTLTLKDVISVLRKQQHSLSKRQIAKGIQQLHRIVPEWIVLSDCNSLAPDTTVWLKPAAYKTIRFRLTGTTAVTPKKKKSVLVDENATSTPPTKPAPHMTRKHPSVTMTSSRSTDHALAAVPVTQPPSSTPPPPPRRDLAVPSWSGTKRPAATTPTPSKKRKGLRVNPHFILSNADYDGGEVIRPSTCWDSPRGLKTLFEQMKAGRRI